MYKKILVPLDGSALAEAALPSAQALAHCTGAEIVLVRVAPAVVYEYLVPEPMAASIAPEGIEANREEIQLYLDHVAAGLRREGLHVSTHYCQGPVADAILDYAQAARADLIVMSTHGRSGLARWIIGSVADRVVHAAPIPVLLIRPSLAAAEPPRGQ